jgi:hypothetical protein
MRATLSEKLNLAHGGLKAAALKRSHGPFWASQYLGN